jgi:hypothetical protein
LGFDAAGQPLLTKKKEIAKKPIGNTLGRCNLRRDKLRKYGKNCLGEIIRGLEELKQDIMVLTETKNNGNAAEILRPYLYFIVEYPKKKKSDEYFN